MPTGKKFAPILKVLRDFAHLGEPTFVDEFELFCKDNHYPVGRRSIKAWLYDGAENGDKSGEPHWPHDRNLSYLAEFFQKRLGCAELTEDMFKHAPDELKAKLGDLLSKQRKDLPEQLPFGSDKFEPAEIKDLCGTHLLYRFALVKGRQMISFDAVEVTNGSSPYALSILMYCVPAKDATNERPSLLTEQERFVGQIWKFNQIFFAMTMFNDADETPARRVHTLQFPVLGTRSTSHYGLMGGYGAILRQPFAAHVLLRKLSVMGKTDELRRSWVRPFDLDDPYVAGIEALLRNDIDDGQSVLTVDAGKLLAAKLPPLPTL